MSSSSPMPADHHAASSHPHVDSQPSGAMVADAPSRLGFVFRFIVGVFLGAVIGIVVWWIVAGYPATDPSWGPALITLGVCALCWGIITWITTPGFGFAASIGSSFGIMPGFIPWAMDNTTGLWATQVIMAMGGIIMCGVIVVVVMQALKLLLWGQRGYQERAGQFDLPDRHTRRRKPEMDDR